MKEKFREIFSGLQSAYGQYQKGERGENGKQKGKAFIVRKPITDNLWEDHLNGIDPALGIIPINEHNSCKWGCIDIDQYNLNHKDLITKIRNLKLPLIVFRSKSGGAHVFLFTKEFIPASLMQTTLKKISEVLGYSGVEIFPKQTEILVERGDTGNFLNLPYHNQTKGLRYAFDDNGAAMSLEEFYKLYDVYACSREEVEKIEIKEEKIEEVFKDGPPCLNRLARDGFGEGSRNNALFNVAIYFKQANPDSWQDKVVEANLKYMSPPLSNGEVQQLLKSIGKKGYDKYRCKLPPIVDVCNPSLCRTRKFGVGSNEEIMPKLGNLTKYNSNPPQYFLDIGEETEDKKQKRIELKAEQLASPALFSLAMLEKADLLVPKLKEKDWREFYLKPLVDNLQTVQPLESLDPKNQIIALLQDWTTNRQNARTMDDVFNKLPYTDDKREFTYFRMEDFYNFCKKNHWEMDKAKTGNLIKSLKDDGIFVEETRMKIKGQEPRLIKIKTMKKVNASVAPTKYQEQHF
jgi:hypothetical protein